MPIIVHNVEEIDRLIEIIRRSAAGVIPKLAEQAPLELFWQIKFGLFGKHPIEDRSLNFVEQINQTWTFVVALEATKLLLGFHGNRDFQIAPGAHAELPFDIVSTDGKICAETFAAVSIRNNRKLRRDLEKLERHPEISHRYIFFMCPSYPRTEQQTRLEKNGVKIWSIDPSRFLTAPTPASPSPAHPASADTCARP